MKPTINSSQNSAFLLIAFLACLALFLAFYGAAKSLWLDEAYSVLVAKQSFSEMLVSLENDAHPPLYYLLLSVWIKIFGDGEITLRSLSALFYLGGVFTIYWLGQEIYERRVGFLAAFLYALSPLATGTAHSARMYALLGFLSALSTFLFVKIFLQNNSSKFVFWACVVVNCLGTFTQIWFFFLLASQILTYLILFYPTARVRFFALPVFSVIPFVILWTPILMIQLKIGATAWIGRPGLAEIVAVLLGFYGERVAAIFYLSIIVLLFLSSKFWSARERSVFWQDFKRHFQTKQTLAFILIFAFAILIPFLVGQFKPIFGQTRFTIIALPAFVLIFASLLYKLVNRTALIIFCVFLLCLVVYAFARYYNRSEPCSDRSITAELLKKAERGDIIIFTSSSRTTADYYLDRFNVAGNFVEFTFPRELDVHPGWRNAAKMLEKREILEDEAEDLLAPLHDLTTEKPQRRIWLFHGLDVEVNNILKKRLDENFTLQGKINAPRAGASERQSDAFCTEILLYQTAAE